jgi:hypothetical protein
VLGNLIRDGLIVDHGRYRDRTYALNAGFPAHAELKALLKKLWEMHPSVDKLAQSRAWHLGKRPSWHGDIEKLFGTKPRTLPLLNIGALGAVDGASLCRLVPQHDVGCLRMALAMFEYQGILKTHFEGNARMYSLNTRYGAYQELRSLLRGIIKRWPNYATSASLEEPLMSAHRLTMRRNQLLKAAQ